MNSKTTRLAIALMTALIVCAISAVGWAGLAPDNFAPLPISEEEPTDEAVFPAPVVFEEVRVGRADRKERTSKSWMGSLSISVDGYEPEYAGGADPYEHEGIEDSQYGLLFEVEGEAPEGLLGNFPTEQPVVLLSPSNRLTVIWGDSDTRRDTIDLTITATWVDRYGRTGPTSDPVHVMDGSSTLGCSSIGSGTAPASILVVFLAFLGFAKLRKWRC